MSVLFSVALLRTRGYAPCDALHLPRVPMKGIRLIASGFLSWVLLFLRHFSADKQRNLPYTDFEIFVKGSIDGNNSLFVLSYIYGTSLMPPVSFKIPYDNNLRYLPLVYLLPSELMVKCPTLMKIPRNPRQVFCSEEFLNLIDSDAFLNEILDAVSLLVFPHFGFRGWKEHYTGYFPAWMLSYLLPLWVKEIEQETGWGLQRLFLLPRNAEIIFLSDEQIHDLFEKVVKRVIEKQDWQPMLDVIHQMPCDEDFEKQRTQVRTDFLRKWYHTRSKNVQSVSLERFFAKNWDSEDDRLFYLPDARLHLEDYVCARVDAERFLSSLPETDRRIAQMRLEGYTYVEIAATLGFANHSSVIKRMEGIKKKYRQYTEA